MKPLPGTIRITLLLLLLNALVWLFFGLIVVLGLHPALHVDAVYKWGMAVVSFLAAGFLVTLMFLLFRRWKPAWYLAVAALVVSALLTLFDDIGWVDIGVLLVMLVPLVLLLIDRKWYLGTRG